MASPELSARLQYLNNSAHLLATTAPETSRYLMSRCNTLMFDNEIDQDMHNRRACGACGSLIMPGWEGTLESQSGRRKVSKKGKTFDNPMQPRTIVYECGTCGRKTREHIKAAPSARRLPSVSSNIKTAEKLGQSSAMLSGHTPSSISSSANSSSKKRAKTRKGGLAAILAQKKSTDASASGFDLMDFMTKA